MTGGIWAFMVIASLLFGVFNGCASETVNAALSGAADAAALMLLLAGGYMLWMGIMEIASQSGLANIISKALSYPLAPLFKDVKKGSEAMGAICMNLASNMLGMGNAATPFGIAAMTELQKQNNSNVASNAMVMLLSINISSVQLIPTSIIALRAAAGSVSPESVTIDILIATTITTAASIAFCKLFEGIDN